MNRGGSRFEVSKEESMCLTRVDKIDDDAPSPLEAAWSHHVPKARDRVRFEGGGGSSCVSAGLTPIGLDPQVS